MSSIAAWCTMENFLRNDKRRLRHFGVVQIMIGMINLTFGITLYYAATFVVAIRLWVPWWAGFLFVISGALTMWNVDSPEPRVRAPMLILALLFLYCVVELIIALLCGIILCKN
ncbi:uncharacterized protein [Scyliorhinus torazame]|uniref:uncharacterized protein isoform X3 n=1 Tax=Scyliorhinus torazame TaxID=75743 RepID=UPI003B5BBDA2